MLLETNNLGKRYGGLWALQNLSLEVESGELRGIIGPNGAGKSTLFNLIIGRQKPTTGTVTFRDRNLHGLRPDQRTRLGITIKFQLTNIFNGLTVLDNIRIGIAGCVETTKQHSIGAKSEGKGDYAFAILEQINLAEKAGDIAGTLSHGEKQWLEIGMALATEPVLLLLDEPTSGMGREETQKTAELIQRLKQNLTILVIEHDMEFVRNVSDKISVLHRGSFLTEGTYDEIKTDKRVIEAYLGKGR